jgi:nitrogen-specific signal transduction histidine kinase/PAS domain-containing protein
LDIELLKKALQREKLARKEAEAIIEKNSLQLYKTNQQLQEVITNTNLFPEENPNAVMRFSAHGRVLMYSNKHGEDIILFLNEKVNKPLKNFFTEQLSFSFEKEVHHQFDMKIGNKTIMFNTVPFPLKDYINVYTADISEIRAAGTRLQNITNSLKEAQQVARMGSWEWDIESDKMTWSDELFYVFEVDPKKTKPSYEAYINLLHPDDQQDAIDAIDKAIKHQERYTLIQRRIFDNTGQKYIECRGYAGLGEKGEVKRLFGICIDITEKIEAQQVKENFTKKLELKVNERTKELVNSEMKLKKSLMKEKELGELKTSFVSTASHQFRTPLAVIQSNSELLQILSSDMDEETSKRFKKVTGRITGEITKMTELMDEVLMLGKLTSGNVDVKTQELNLVDFCQKLAKRFNNLQTDGRVINVSTTGKPCTVNLDPKLLTHSLSNLLSNAFKYSLGKQNPELAISFKSKELVLSVKDYGIGIPKDDFTMLFQPFFRANNVTEIKGTGLGLSIAKEYIEKNNGQITAKSIQGEGSCFEVTFNR